MTTQARSTPSSTPATSDPRPLVRLTSVSRSFGTENLALDRVSLAVDAGEIHALLGPNGAGKSTLLRILCNLVEATSGDVDVLGLDRTISRTGHKGEVNLVPSGDRTFYLRLSGLENLIFFARLHGLSFRHARRRSLECLADVDLTDVARRPVATYSHGMQKRLSVARAMLTRPRLLLVDEATHDLDPHAATVVQGLVKSVAEQGTAVLWATQRLDEIRGFADQVTVLDKGRVRFSGTVTQLQAEALTRRFVLRLGAQDGVVDHALVRRVLAGSAVVEALDGDAEHVVVFLGEEDVLGDAITRLTQAGVRVLTCREERSGIEAAFLAVTGQPEEA